MGKITFVRKNMSQQISGGVIRIDKEACEIVQGIHNETGLPFKEIVSQIIKDATAQMEIQIINAMEAKNGQI